VHRFSRTAASLATVGLLALGGVAASAVAASAGTIGSCSAQGDFADCGASGTANHPLTITVTVKSSPDESVTVFWDTVCSQGTGAGSSSGSFTATTPVTRTISHPYHQPDSCDVAANGGLNGSGNSINVSIASSSTAPPPPVHAIKGYDGKCVDDTANSSAKGTKIVLWSCDKTAAQNWSFSSGELHHNGKCANDSGNAGSGGKVVLYTCSSAKNDRWAHKSNGEYVLKSHNSTLCLDDPGYSRNNGTQLVVYACKDTSNQRWSLP
jgi:Ricin-type beta-trefoil lectin domain